MFYIMPSMMAPRRRVREDGIRFDAKSNLEFEMLRMNQFEEERSIWMRMKQSTEQFE